MTDDRDSYEIKVGSWFHSFWIGDEEWASGRGPLQAGLLEIADTRNGLFVDTAVHSGLVSVRIQVLLDPPRTPLSQWDDIAEASIRLSSDQLYVIPLGGLGDMLEAPVCRAGEFGIQVAGKCRDQDADLGQLESYLISVWPVNEVIEPKSLRLSSPRAKEKGSST